MWVLSAWFVKGDIGLSMSDMQCWYPIGISISNCTALFNRYPDIEKSKKAYGYCLPTVSACIGANVK